MSKRGFKIEISALFYLIPDSSHSLSLHLLQAFSLLKICSPSISFAFKVCFLSYTLVSHAFFGWLLMRVVQIIRNFL